MIYSCFKREMLMAGAVTVRMRCHARGFLQGLAVILSPSTDCICGWALNARPEVQP